MGTKIEWCNETWSPVVGCSKVSAGCDNCCAERMACRLYCMGIGRKGNSIEKYGHVIHEAKWNGKTFCDEKALEIPLHWKKPRQIFVCSMSDLFHESVPFEFIDKVIEVTEVTPWHTYQILTKRPERMLEYFNWRWNNADQHSLDYTKAKQWRKEHKIKDIFNVLPNLWLGVTAENQEMADKRIPILLQIPAAVRFVSIEPMLGPVDLRNLNPGYWARGQYVNALTGDISPSRRTGDEKHLSWVIVGGESGLGARPMHPDWAKGVRDQCVAAGVPFFFKQWGEWLPLGQHPMTKTAILTNRDKRIYNLSDGFYGKPMLRGIMEHIDKDGTFPGNYIDCPVYRVGKKKAGRLLDGKEWSEYPQITNPKGGE